MILQTKVKLKKGTKPLSVDLNDVSAVSPGYIDIECVIYMNGIDYTITTPYSEVHKIWNDTKKNKNANPS